MRSFESIAQLRQTLSDEMNAEREAINSRIKVHVGEPSYIAVKDGGPCNPFAGESLTRVATHPTMPTYGDWNRQAWQAPVSGHDYIESLARAESNLSGNGAVRDTEVVASL
jgi:hypothetical protein